ncbi:MAG: oligoendopeptidase F [Bacillota bacterium]
MKQKPVSASRSERDERDQWRLEDIFESDALWDESYAQVQESLKNIAALKGTMTKSAGALLHAMETLNDIERRAEKLFVYASMRRDEDNARAEYQEKTDRALNLLVRLESETAFVEPELLQADAKTIEDFISQEPGLNVYAHGLRDLQRQKPHVLDAERERLLAMSGEVAAGPSNIFKMLNNADIKFGSVMNEKGEEIEITHGSYTTLLESRERRVRRETYEKLYDAYQELINTISAIYSTSVKKDVFFAKAHNFPSAMEGSLFADNVPVHVYDTLIDTVHKHLPAMHRYVALRKRVLGVSTLHMYDVLTPLVPDAHMTVDYHEACELVLKGIAPMGEEYMGLAKQAFENRWVDVYENKGKTSGAYSWGHYDTHPYILLNFQPTIDNAFTLAHELGHALHSYYSNTSQHYANAGYPILLAEVASTVNESLLLQHLLKTTEDPQTRMYLLNHYLDQFRGTVFRQVMFAEFERDVHKEIEAGRALTKERLCAMYKELNQAYYGPDMALDDRITLEWARIPHFYTAFYVYKYATGFSSAIQISKGILEGREGAVSGYIEFLKSGGSDYPLELLKKAGVDLTTAQPVDSCLQLFTDVLKELETMMDN